MFYHNYSMLSGYYVEETDVYVSSLIVVTFYFNYINNFIEANLVSL